MDSVQEWQQKLDEMSWQEDAQGAVTSSQFLTRSLSKSDFLFLKSKGIRFFGSTVRFQYFPGTFEGLELGITAFKKGGNAVRRNYFKRLVREIFRKKQSLLPAGLKLQVLPSVSLEKISYQAILLDFNALCMSILNKKELSKP